MSYYDFMESFKPAFKLLNDRHQVVFVLRLRGLTLKEVAEIMHLSRERVRQMENKAYAIIHRELRDA